MLPDRAELLLNAGYLAPSLPVAFNSTAAVVPGCRGAAAAIL